MKYHIIIIMKYHIIKYHIIKYHIIIIIKYHIIIIIKYHILIIIIKVLNLTSNIGNQYIYIYNLLCSRVVHIIELQIPI